jgi:hypothetical protein
VTLLLRVWWLCVRLHPLLLLISRRRGGGGCRGSGADACASVTHCLLAAHARLRNGQVR